MRTPPFLLFFLLAQYCHERKMPGDYTAQREAMVREQIAAEGVHDARVLDAMRKVPRHEFVPADMKPYAYRNGPLPIGYGQTISQPYIVAFMTEALQLEVGMKVLEIGTGSAYQAAILAEMGARLYTIEIVPELCSSARDTLARLGYHVKLRCGNGYLGWPEEAPFDRIILTAAPPEIPQPLLHQLKEGGILVAPVGEGVQTLVRLRRDNNMYKEERLLPVRFVPMVNEPKG